MDVRTHEAPSPPSPHILCRWGPDFVLTLQLEVTPSPPAQTMVVFTELPHQLELEHVA
jgi:hypothetical protein